MVAPRGNEAGSTANDYRNDRIRYRRANLSENERAQRMFEAVAGMRAVRARKRSKMNNSRHGILSQWLINALLSLHRLLTRRMKHLLLRRKINRQQ